MYFLYQFNGWRGMPRTALRSCGIYVCCLSSLWLSACGEQRGAALEALEPAASVGQPGGWADDLQLAAPRDLNPDPNILEIELEARIEPMEIRPGTLTPVWTYSGGLPGPLIRAKLGDTIIVHFSNALPEATSIHWHGMRLDNDMDGVPGITQPPVEPGGELRYEFVARDAGTFWYHPHINSAAQVGQGLYGPLVVEDPDDPEAFGDDVVLLLSDMSLDADGQFLPADHGGAFGDLFGREGSTLLVNGRVVPTLKVRAGKPQRWRVINGARARYYTIALRGHSIVKLGGDNGLAARSTPVNRVVLVPGERADLVVIPSRNPDATAMLQWIPTDRGFGSVFNRPRQDMLRIETVDEAPVAPAAIPEFLRQIEPIDISDAIELDLDLTIDTQRTREGSQIVMGINGVPYWDSKPLMASIGQTQVWTLINDTAFSHPFHLHGYFFQVLDETRIPEWKDTVDIPADSSVRIAIQFDERPGVWMYHCHILDHADVGMMGHLFVGADEHSTPPELHLMH